MNAYKILRSSGLPVHTVEFSIQRLLTNHPATNIIVTDFCFTTQLHATFTADNITHFFLRTRSGNHSLSIPVLPECPPVHESDLDMSGYQDYQDLTHSELLHSSDKLRRDGKGWKDSNSIAQ